jgi:hypothetical protein
MAKKISNANDKSYARLIQEPKFAEMLGEFLIEGEQVVDSLKSAKEGVVFTTKRIVICNASGFLGKKKEFSSVPFNRINTFVLSSAKDLESHAKLDLGFFGTPNLHFEFAGKSEIKLIMKYISEAVLK